MKQTILKEKAITAAEAAKESPSEPPSETGWLE
jgi:hypothetical protein